VLSHEVMVWRLMVFLLNCYSLVLFCQLKIYFFEDGYMEGRSFFITVLPDYSFLF
jgi:hypothetical protein